jgi:hypothetical protein
MTSSRNFVCSAALGALLTLGALSPALADTLFWDQMSSASAANWGSNATVDTAATFGYNYSAVGIPEAPNSMGGDVPTVGVKLEANLSSATASRILLYPTGQNFTGEYKLSFDAWMNYDLQELILGDAVGTTEFLGGGIGYDGLANDLTSGAQAINTGEGGSASDYRVFKSPPQFFVAAADMTGGSRNNSDPYYTSFLPGQAPPAVQGQPAALVGPPGTAGFQWITWHFGVQDEAGQKIVRITLEKPNGDLLSLATVNCSDSSDGSSGCTTNGNISLFYGDLFTSVSPRPDLTYGIIDNVHVESIPEPASILLFALSSVGWIARRRSR